MSDRIVFDADGLAAAAEKAQSLQAAVESTRSQLESLYGQLVSVTGSLDSSIYVPVATLVSKKKLQAQAARMERLVSVLNEAAGLTDTATKNVEGKLDAFGLFISAFQSAVSGLRHLPAVVSLAAVGNAFGNLIQDTFTSVAQATEKIVDRKLTPEQITANVGSRDAEIMKIFESDKSDYLGKGRTFVNKKTGQEQISCVYFTWRKIQQLLGSNCTKSIYSSSKMRSLNGQTVTADDGTKYLVTTYDAKKASELVESIDQPAENIVLSFTVDSHLMMIDRIQDGMVYFSDNSPSSWNTYQKTGIYPTQTMTLEEFGNYYDTHNDSFSAKAYSLTKQK